MNKIREFETDGDSFDDVVPNNKRPLKSKKKDEKKDESEWIFVRGARVRRKSE